MDVLSLIKEVSAWFYGENHVLISNLYVLAFSIAAFLLRKNDNALAVLLLLSLPSVIDIKYLNDILLSMGGPAFYLYYSVFDFVVILLILFRKNIMSLYFLLTMKSKRLFGWAVEGPQTFEYVRYLYEYKMIALYAASIFVNVLVAIEYPIRENYYKEALYLYYSYKPIKVVINIALIYYVYRMVFYTRKTYLVKELRK